MFRVPCDINLNNGVAIQNLCIQDSTTSDTSESIERAWSCLRSTILHHTNNGWRDGILEKKLTIADRGKVKVVFELHVDNEELRVNISKF
jgi:hypothetical protein